MKAGRRTLLRIIMINTVWQPKSVMSDHEATVAALCRGDNAGDSGNNTPYWLNYSVNSDGR